MLEVSKIEVDNRFSNDFLVVRWELADTWESLLEYDIDLMRSLSPESGFTPVATKLKHFEFKDTTVNLLNPNIRYYYRVHIKNQFTKEEALSELLGELHPGTPDPIVDIIVHQQKVGGLDLITNGVNNAKLLIKRRSGQRCPDCWDPVRKNVRKSNCTTCYGTGFKDGYMDPINIQVAFSSHNKQLKTDMTDVREAESLVTAWTSNYPIISPEDIIVDEVNKRYRVHSWQFTPKGRYVIRQIFTLQAVPPTNIIYKFPVK